MINCNIPVKVQNLLLHKMLWQEPKRADGKQLSANLNEWKRCWKEEWAKILPQPCKKLKTIIESHCC